MLQVFLNALLGAEADAVCGAAYGSGIQNRVVLLKAADLGLERLDLSQFRTGRAGTLSLSARDWRSPTGVRTPCRHRAACAQRGP
jgi:hypothetical protein